MAGLGKLLAEGAPDPSPRPSSLGATLTARAPEALFNAAPAPPPSNADFSLLRLSPDEVAILEEPLQILQQAFPNLHISRDRQGVFLLIPSRRKQEFLEVASETGFDPSVLKRVESGGAF